MDIVRRELIYIWYYFSGQFEQLFGYWMIGMRIGSLISVFAKDTLHGAVKKLQADKAGVLGIVPAGILGQPLPCVCMGRFRWRLVFVNLGSNATFWRRS